MAEIDARIDQLAQMRRTLVAVMAADCDSLTDCSCGLGGNRRSPDPAAPRHSGQDAPVALR